MRRHAPPIFGSFPPVIGMARGAAPAVRPSLTTLTMDCPDELAAAANRYMRQLGASHGVYVVVWMDLPRREELLSHHRPKWPFLDGAREDLQREASRLLGERGMLVRTIVVDASLR